MHAAPETTGPALTLPHQQDRVKPSQAAVPIRARHLPPVRSHQSWSWARKPLLSGSREKDHTPTQIAVPSVTGWGRAAALTGHLQDRKRTSTWKTAGHCPPEPGSRPSREPEAPLQAHGHQQHAVAAPLQPYQWRLHEQTTQTPSTVGRCPREGAHRCLPAAMPRTDYGYTCEML